MEYIAFRPFERTGIILLNILNLPSGASARLDRLRFRRIAFSLIRMPLLAKPEVPPFEDRKRIFPEDRARGTAGPWRTA